MKTTIVLKEFSDLSCGALRITHVSVPAIPEASPPPPTESGEPGEDLRESMHRRYTTPLVGSIPYHRWGINE